MRATRTFLTFIFLISILSCSKEDLTRGSNSGLIGKWKLTEYLADPGDGSGKWTKVDDATTSIIEFKTNGSFVEVNGVALSSIPFFNAYKILDSTRIEMTPIDKSQAKHIWYYSDLTPKTLTIGYGCIEACSGRYVAVE